MSTAAEAYAAAAQPGLRPMREADLEAVMAIERRAYPFPWTPGIFRDCLRAGYAMWVLECADGGLAGYGVLSIAADEAHVLNLCTAPGHEGRGLGRRMLQALLKIARGHGARRIGAGGRCLQWQGALDGRWYPRSVGHGQHCLTFGGQWLGRVPLRGGRDCRHQDR